MKDKIATGASLPRIPIIKEVASIRKRKKITRIQIRKTVSRRKQTVDEPTYRNSFEIKRISKNQFLDAPVKPRKEGETLILPVFEEVVSVQKRLLLREELHITPQQETIRRPQTVELKTEHIHVQRAARNRGEQQTKNNRST
jgi:uncharacterized protein (TIGR02271 family)